MAENATKKDLDSESRLNPDFAWLKDSRLSPLLRSAKRIDLTRYQKVYSEFCYVGKGVLAERRELIDGRRVIEALYHKGDFIDFNKNSRSRQGELVALTKAIVFAFNRHSAATILKAHPEIARSLYESYSEHNSRVRDHLVDLAVKTPIEKLASFVFELRRWSDDPDQSDIDVPIRSVDTAEYVGLRSETVSRTMKKLFKDKLIETPDRNHIRILDPVKLRWIANGGSPRRSGGDYL